MAGTSIDGLVSGLSTSDLISQLMQVESLPKQKLQAKITTHQSTQGALQQINTKLKSLFTAADGLTTADAFTAVKATSSSDAVTATAIAGAATGQLTFKVDELAKAHVVTSEFATAATPVVDLVAGLKITINGTQTPITVAANKNTPQGVADAINAANLAVKAAAVEIGGGKVVLQLTATKTGLVNGLTVDGTLQAVNEATPPQDAEITVGTGAGAYTVKSSTNSFTSLMSGVTLTVSATTPTSDVTVGVTRDVSAIGDKIKAMVDAANFALADISLKSAPDSTTSPLKGNALIRQTASSVLGAVGGGMQTTVGGVTTYTSYSGIGVELDKSGRLTFDKSAFVAAFEKDPTGTQALVKDGLAKALKDVADTATNSTTGTLTQILKTGETYERRLNAEVTNWDSRLALRKQALQRQFSGLEVALSKMKQQSSWLAGQIASLG
jgi:flagellar hook-associated protein 2